MLLQTSPQLELTLCTLFVLLYDLQKLSDVCTYYVHL